MLKEITIGVVIAGLLFLTISGYDVVPLLVLGGIALLIYLVLGKTILKDTFITSYQPQPEITFNDIGGQASAKQELKEALDFMIYADKIKELGIRPLKGILLAGAPGTGKTLLAKAAANYTDAVFLAVNGSEFVEIYAGVGAMRVRQLFKRAKELAKKDKKDRAIIFIDEIEVLGNKRGTHSSHLEYDQTLNQLLVEMDGIRSDDQTRILVIAATNRIDMIDPALLRPGRFDRVVRVDLPDKNGRLEILKLHTRNKPLSSEVDLVDIARQTFGFSGAQLESVANEAAIMAMREKVNLIYPRHFKEAIDKVMLGERLNKKPTREELRRVAIHETGHAIVGELLRPNSVSHLSITSRGSALGYMRQSSPEDLYLFTRQYLEDQIKICLAGAVAEEIILGNRSTGATNDFQEAIRLARQIISSGLSELGIVSIENLTQNQLQTTVNGIITSQENQVRCMLLGYSRLIWEIVSILEREESLSGEDLRKMLQQTQYSPSVSGFF
ncbi:AAA family ATPase [Calderihabitans maritimus]|uniref:ATP-dependent Zn proteases n=1 Tax=Calderihabitans maritimus TaxID=1246530 RepID=A0A1Z5HQF1_9FIRM|nr:AAA family ATPase [Calderihabitans maritimus]GAW91541.1 ATP-dependent Zn proteases [Calderihabitans maritimus]